MNSCEYVSFYPIFTDASTYHPNIPYGGNQGKSEFGRKDG